MTGPGLKEEDPLMILDDEDDDDIDRSGAFDFFGVHPPVYPRQQNAKNGCVAGKVCAGQRAHTHSAIFNCPLCTKLMFKPPHRVIALEDLTAALYPNMPDNTAVEWGRAWDGLNFPVDI
ncbi:hypothetical protein B0H10DRAFT_1939431 [Mycena sp. CBHHK59/15]|nr:hypothetical protein B0H10DRAFT_1939431 [Mycena sp. CBHHK59/15]